MKSIFSILLLSTALTFSTGCAYNSKKCDGKKCEMKKEKCEGKSCDMKKKKSCCKKMKKES